MTRIAMPPIASLVYAVRQVLPHPMRPTKVAVAQRVTMFGFGAGDVPVQVRTGFRNELFDERRSFLLHAHIGTMY